MRLPVSARDVLPLPRDYFECPELGNDEEERLIQVARTSCQRLIETTYSPNSEWSTVSVKNGVRISKNVQPPLREYMSSISDNQYSVSSGYKHGGPFSSSEAGCSSAKLIRGTTTVSATIEEIALQFKVDRGQNLMKSRKDILDSMVLYNLVRPSGARPRDYVGIFWECVKSPVPFSHHRDFLYLECHEEFDTPDGRRGWGYSMHSIKLACCPPLDALKLTRASVYNSGFVFMETLKAGEIECHYFLNLDAMGPSPAVSDFMARRKLSALSHLNKVLQEQRLECEPLLGDLDLPHLHHPKNECALCYKRFQFFHRKHTCRKCGEVMCKSCQSTWELDLPGVGVRQICICTLCSAQSRGTSSHPDAVGRMRQVYEEGQADMDIAADDDDGATMITDISCSISQYFAPHDDTSDAYINNNPPNAMTRDQPPDRVLVNGPVDGVSTEPNVLSSSSEHRSRRPSFPPYLLEHGGRTSGGTTTSATHMPLPSVLVPRLPKQHHQVHPHVHLSSLSLAYQYGGGAAPDTHDDVISLGSEERFSLHSSRQYNHHHHDRVSAAALLGSVRLGGGVPEIDHEDHHGSSHVHSQHRMSPPRPSYDASVDNLVNPSTWKSHHHQHHHHPTTANTARIEIGSNHRFG